jgi:hypothetical protein
MTTYTEQIKELCEANSIEYFIHDNQVLIDNEFWFYINNMDDINNFKTYIHIIKGRNEMVNTICDKLNTTIEKGCNLKLFEYHQNEMVLINMNSIILNINNLTHMNYPHYTKYENFINISLKIVLKSPLDYYLIIEDNKKSYKLKSTIDLSNVLDQLYTFEKKKCSKDLCDGMVDMKKDFPNPYGLCEEKSEYMLSTSHGYRNKSSSSTKYYFCSKECMDWFDKYNRCHRCHEDGTGTYIEELGYTLCNGRGDCNPSCIAKYRLEQRFKKDYKHNGFYEIDTKLKNCLLGDCDELKKIITDNDNKITYSMLMDLMNLKANFEVREREENEPTDKLTFEEQCQSIKEELY